MRCEKYNMSNGSWQTCGEVDHGAVLEDVRAEVGNEDIAIRWDGDVPIVDSDLLSGSGGEGAVKSAIEMHHPNMSANRRSRGRISV